MRDVNMYAGKEAKEEQRERLRMCKKWGIMMEQGP